MSYYCPPQISVRACVRVGVASEERAFSHWVVYDWSFLQFTSLQSTVLQQKSV